MSDFLLDEVQTCQYLERIGLPQHPGTTGSALAVLQKKHLQSVPYENLDILADGEVSPLEVEPLFDKVVSRRQGGYCFELNGLFAVLLRSLGFEVSEHFGRWHLGESMKIPYQRHRVLLVTAADGGKFICDVGVASACPVEALDLSIAGTEQYCNGTTYRIIKDDILGFRVQSATGNGFADIYSFSPEKQFAHDFEYAHYFCCKAPGSRFRKKLFMHHFTDNGRVYIGTAEDGSLMLCTRNFDGSSSDMPLKSPEETVEVINSLFGIYRDDLIDIVTAV